MPKKELKQFHQCRRFEAVLKLGKLLNLILGLIHNASAKVFSEKIKHRKNASKSL